MSAMLPAQALVTNRDTEASEVQSDSGTWAAAVASPSFRRLMTTKARLVWPLLGASLAFVVAMTLLAGYDRPFMAIKVVGAFNVGYLMILMTYLLCWVVAVIYVLVANKQFELQSRQAIADLNIGSPR